ncbi:hypothetical protein ACM42_11485 [Bradyrhizobium sp. CCBAU 25338]|nr:hypothetical protein [Bradyrhizobium sp. CCBAU 25338]
MKLELPQIKSISVPSEPPMVQPAEASKIGYRPEVRTAEGTAVVETDPIRYLVQHGAPLAF